MKNQKITLGRFDIATAVMTMSGFCAAQCARNLERVEQICAYLAKMKHGFLRIRTDEPPTTPECPTNDMTEKDQSMATSKNKCRRMHPSP